MTIKNDTSDDDVIANEVNFDNTINGTDDLGITYSDRLFDPAIFAVSSGENEIVSEDNAPMALEGYFSVDEYDISLYDNNSIDTYNKPLYYNNNTINEYNTSLYNNNSIDSIQNYIQLYISSHNEVNFDNIINTTDDLYAPYSDRLFDPALFVIGTGENEIVSEDNTIMTYEGYFSIDEYYPSIYEYDPSLYDNNDANIFIDNIQNYIPIDVEGAESVYVDNFPIEQGYDNFFDFIQYDETQDFTIPSDTLEVENQIDFTNFFTIDDVSFDTIADQLNIISAYNDLFDITLPNDTTFGENVLPMHVKGDSATNLISSDFTLA